MLALVCRQFVIPEFRGNLIYKYVTCRVNKLRRWSARTWHGRSERARKRSPVGTLACTTCNVHTFSSPLVEGLLYLVVRYQAWLLLFLRPSGGVPACCLSPSLSPSESKLIQLRFSAQPPFICPWQPDNIRAAESLIG